MQKFCTESGTAGRPLVPAPLPDPPTGFTARPRRLVDLLAYEGELCIVTADQGTPARFVLDRTRPGQGALKIGTVKP